MLEACQLLSGKGMPALSGGIDSPVVWLLKRVDIEAVHFAKSPYTSPGVEKAQDLTRSKTD